MKYKIEIGFTIINNDGSLKWISERDATKEELPELRVTEDGKVQRLVMGDDFVEDNGKEMVFDDYTTPPAYLQNNKEFPPDFDHNIESVHTVVWWEDVSRTHKAIYLGE